MNREVAVNRRDALRLAATVAVPMLVPGRVWGAHAPSKQVTLGSIGVGGMGNGNMSNFLGNEECRVVAVADVDAKHLEGAANRVNQRYGNQDCKAYRDFRGLLARGDIDAVCISTPDHWHSIPAIMAAQAKKDIYCEKPLSHTLGEGIAMVEAVERNQRIWQTGSWQRSVLNFRWAAGLVANGRIGKIKRVEVGLPSGHSNRAKGGGKAPFSDPPQEVDYNFWIGPARMMPFNEDRFHFHWRWNYNTGGGQMMDWIGHHCDIGHWGLSNPEFGCGPDDRVGPLTVSATAEFPPQDAIWNTATRYRVTCQYPNQVEMVLAGGHSDIRGGTKWIGTDGWIWVNRGGFDASNKEWVDTLKRGKNRVEEAEEKFSFRLMVSTNHWVQFIDSVKSRKPTVTPIAVAHRSQTPGHLGLIAARLGRTLKWDAAAQQIIGDAEASQMVSKTFRPPWHLPV